MGFAVDGKCSIQRTLYIASSSRFSRSVLVQRPLPLSLSVSSSLPLYVCASFRHTAQRVSSSQTLKCWPSCANMYIYSVAKQTTMIAHPLIAARFSAPRENYARGNYGSRGARVAQCNCRRRRRRIIKVGKRVATLSRPVAARCVDRGLCPVVPMIAGPQGQSKVAQ